MKTSSCKDLEDVDVSTDIKIREIDRSETNRLKLMKYVCSFYGIEPLVLKIKNRKKQIIKCRRLYCYLAYEIVNEMNKYHKVSLSEIGRDVGINNHASVLNHIKKLEHECSINPAYLGEVISFLNKYSSIICGPKDNVNRLSLSLSDKLIKFQKIRNKKIISSTGREFVKIR